MEKRDVETAVGDTRYNFMLAGFNSQHAQNPNPPLTSSARRDSDQRKCMHIAAGEFGN